MGITGAGHDPLISNVDPLGANVDPWSSGIDPSCSDTDALISDITPRGHRSRPFWLRYHP